MSERSIAPLPVTREQIITEGGIPAEIFDYVDKAFKDPSVLQSATGVSYWFPCAGEAMREIRINEKRSLFFSMIGPQTLAGKGHVRLVDTTAKDAWKKPALRGPLTLKMAQSAVAAIRKLTAVKA
jgi:hypothetical protein